MRRAGTGPAQRLSRTPGPEPAPRSQDNRTGRRLVRGAQDNGNRLMADISLNLANPVPQVGAIARIAEKAGASWQLRVVIMWLVLVLMLLAIDAPQIAVGRFGDPDDALRLMEVRDLIAGQSWFDLHQYRIAAPEGVPMHWSRLVDIPLAAMILALRPLVGMAWAETVTVVAVPLLTLLATLMLVGRMTAKFFDTETVGIACLVTGIGGPLLFQMTPMRIDHHGWQVVLALVALNGLAARDALRGGLVIGAALAALLAISIEGLPITAVFLAVLALRGLRPDGQAAAGYTGLPAAGYKGPAAAGYTGLPAAGYTGLAAASTALAGASLAIFLGTRGLGDLATHCDQISPIHIALFAVIMAGCSAIAVLRPQRMALALGMLGATVAATAALYLGVAPQCRGGAFVALDPMVYHYWYEGVAEGMPFWHLPLAIAIETVGVPLVGLASLAVLWFDAADAAQRAWWRDHALVLAGALLIGGCVARASATACALAAIPTGAAVLRAIIALRTVAPLRRTAGYIGILVLLMPPLPVIAFERARALIPDHTGARTVSADMPLSSQCKYRVAARALNALPATDLFLPLDIGPDILVRTHQRVVATGHHRGAAGMRDVIAAFLGTPDQAHAIVRRRHATMIAICPDIPEPANYRYYAPDGFMAQLLRGKTPAWLEPVDLAPGSNLKFWRVKS